MSRMTSTSAHACIPATVALYNYPWSSLGFYINANSFEDDEFKQTDFMASVIHSSLYSVITDVACMLSVLDLTTTRTSQQ